MLCILISIILFMTLEHQEVYWIRILKDLWYSIKLLNSINKFCGIQLTLLDFLRKTTKSSDIQLRFSITYIKILLVLKNIQISMYCFLRRILMDFIILFSIKHLLNNLTLTLEILLDFFSFFFYLLLDFLFSHHTYSLLSLIFFKMCVSYIFLLFFWNKNVKYTPPFAFFPLLSKLNQCFCDYHPPPHLNMSLDLS